MAAPAWDCCRPGQANPKLCPSVAKLNGAVHRRAHIHGFAGTRRPLKSLHGQRRMVLGAAVSCSMQAGAARPPTVPWLQRQQSNPCMRVGVANWQWRVAAAAPVGHGQRAPGACVPAFPASQLFLLLFLQRRCPCRYAWSTWLAIVLTVLCFPAFVFLTETLALKVWEGTRLPIGGNTACPGLHASQPAAKQQVQAARIGLRMPPARTTATRQPIGPSPRPLPSRPPPRRARRGAAC